MLAKVKSCTVLGLEVELVEVEVDSHPGFPKFHIVGLPDLAVQESRQRVKSAIRNSGFHFPDQTFLVVNLAPADIKKEGPQYDLPIALGILISQGQLTSTKEIQESLFIGELSLKGDLRFTRGILPVAIFARSQGIKRLYLPSLNAPEAVVIEGIEIMPVSSLKALVEHLVGREVILPFSKKEDLLKEQEEEFEYDFTYIKGQEHTKRALEIAASGGHNVFLTGPPGAGKTLLARAMPSILPQMKIDEILEVTKIYSIAGLLSKDKPLVKKRPFRSPHHTSSSVALVGGGQFPRPGEVSLAHRGVLFLDEFPEFSRHVLESLRQPLEDGIVTISRAQASFTFPASFTLIASQNPCPCGFYSDSLRNCTCLPSQILRYRRKVSGPLLDRIDLHLEVPRVKLEKLAQEKVAELSCEVRKRVQRARDVQFERFRGRDTRINAEMSIKEIKEFCCLDFFSQELLQQAANQMHLSARGYHRILKISRTIADLAQEEKISRHHIAEALQYRMKGE